MSNKRWVVHPNRSALGPDEPGRNGHFRSVSLPPPDFLPEETHRARVELPPSLLHESDGDGSVTFAGRDWHFVVGAARAFAGDRTEVNLPNPFGFRDRGRWHWWDGAVTTESRLEGPDAERYVMEFFERLFLGMPVTLSINGTD
ncbi:hypothetical protein [Mycobacteroides abscessus]|uniref:hypothetical protein n=1 Tax=Mycobacteroides abscessus TaxID=36809 RepID=UPI00148FF838|nr:hypothetical protein [Mycobacteroides abscessus]